MHFSYEDPEFRELANRIHDLSRDLLLIKNLTAPSIRDIVAAPVIENWSVGHRIEPALIGDVKGHPVVKPGPLVTSELFYLDPVAGYARTLSRWYRLGAPKT